MKLPAPSLARLLLIVLSALLSACASTRFSSEAPTSPGQPGPKLLVMVSTADDTLRRITENQLLADILPADNASAAHRLGIDGQPADPATRERMLPTALTGSCYYASPASRNAPSSIRPPLFLRRPWMWGWPMHGDRFTPSATPRSCPRCIAAPPRRSTRSQRRKPAPQPARWRAPVARPQPHPHRRQLDAGTRRYCRHRDPEAGRTQLAAQEMRRPHQ